MDVDIAGVQISTGPGRPTPVVLLESGDDAVLPVYVGLTEARAIARGIDAVDAGRPLTHELLLDTVEALGGRVERVVIDGRTEDGFVATLHFQTPRGTATVDARPSDSLALVARTHVPVIVDEELFATESEHRESFGDFEDIRNVMT